MHARRQVRQHLVDQLRHLPAADNAVEVVEDDDALLPYPPQSRQRHAQDGGDLHGAAFRPQAGQQRAHHRCQFGHALQAIAGENHPAGIQRVEAVPDRPRAAGGQIASDQRRLAVPAVGAEDHQRFDQGPVQQGKEPRPLQAEPVPGQPQLGADDLKTFRRQGHGYQPPVCVASGPFALAVAYFMIYIH